MIDIPGFIRNGVTNEMVEKAARAICREYGFDADERVKYSGKNKFAKHRDGSYVLQWHMHTRDARAALESLIGGEGDECVRRVDGATPSNSA